MVRRLLGIILGGILGCGCLLSNPPDYEESIEHHPHIKLRHPSQQIVAIQTDDPSGTIQTVFQLEVWDGDVDQILRHRWFLNFDPDVEPQCNLVEEYLTVPSGQEERIVDYPLRHKMLTVGQCHRLTTVVTDGEWLDGPRQGCAELTEGSNKLVADWWIVAYDESVSVEEVTFYQCLTLAGKGP